MVSARPAAATAGAEDKPAALAMTARIRAAVQAAVRCPSAARMMGQSGKAAIAFDYRDGTVLGDVQVARSSGTPALDAAAQAAVRGAHYPEAQTEDLNHVFHLLIWVEEACSD
jgi:protein TonB